MRSKLLFLLRYYIYWIVLSVAAKVIFLFYQGNASLEFLDYCRIFVKGFRIDLSLGGYILMLTAVMMALSIFLKEHVLRISYRVLTLVLLLFFWMVAVTDLEVFKHWGYHVDASPFAYIKTPKQAIASVSNGRLFFLLFLIAVLVVGSFYLYRRCIERKLHYSGGQWWQSLLFLVIGGAMIIPVRGGFNVAPMNSSFVYFHKTNMFANQAAINPIWNFIYEVLHIKNIKNSHQFMDSDEAHALVDSLYMPTVSSIEKESVLKTEKPNVVVLLLESFTADAIGILGGEPGVTPHLEQLAKEGILFSSVYATGNRSPQGLIGTIGGLPAHPDFSLLKYPTRTVDRPSFPKDFEKLGYHSAFYYAGDLNFGGFRSYITMNFDRLVTEDDFSGESKKNDFKWGVHDEYMLDRVYEDMAADQAPYLYMAFTMSSHEPFRVPMETRIEGSSIDRRFLNSICYTDQCVGNFVQKLKTGGMWENTLLVLLADHGTINIKDRQPYEPEAFHIPMIFSGGALQVRDTVITGIGSQTDLAATLLSQFGVDCSHYPYSRNLFEEVAHPFAYYAYPNTVGMVSDQGNAVYSLKSKSYITENPVGANDSWLKAFLQVWDEDINR